MTDERILQVNHLSKSFGKHEVLRDIDFTVNKGDVTSIIGASGSGKSTLLRCINLLETPTSGEIRFHDENILSRKGGAAAYRTKVGMVFQSFNLFNNMTVLENCLVGQTKVLKKDPKEAEEVAMKYLTKVGMAPGSSPAARSSAWPSPAPWPWTRRCCCSTSRPRRWTPKWSVKFSPSCGTWPTRA